MKTRNHHRSAEHKVKGEGAQASAIRSGGWDLHAQITADIIAAMETSQGSGRSLWTSQGSLSLSLAGEPQALFGDQHADPLGLRDAPRFHLRLLADLHAGHGEGWTGPQGRARHPRRLLQTLRGA